MTKRETPREEMLNTLNQHIHSSVDVEKVDAAYMLQNTGTKINTEMVAKSDTLSMQKKSQRY